MEHSPVTRKRSERVSSVTAEPKNLAPRVRRHMSPGASVVRPRLDRERLREEGGLALEGEQHLVAGSELAASGAKCRHPVAEACRVRAIWQAPVIFHPSPDGRSSGRSASLGRTAFAGQPPAEAARALAPTVGTGGSPDSGRLPKRAGCRDSWSQHLLTPSSAVSQAAQPFCGPGS